MALRDGPRITQSGQSLISIALGFVLLSLLTFFLSTFWQGFDQTLALSRTSLLAATNAAVTSEWLQPDVQHAQSITIQTSDILVLQWVSNTNTTYQVTYQETSAQQLLRTVSITTATGATQSSEQVLAWHLAASSFTLSQPQPNEVIASFTTRIGLSHSVWSQTFADPTIAS